jgi:hypothetical protein
LARQQAERFTTARFERELLSILRGRAAPAAQKIAA